MSEHNNMETRVTILERDVQELRQMSVLVHQMDKKLDIALARKECPDPGACMRLVPRVESLEMTRAETKGGGKVIAAIVGASATIGAALSWLFTHFQHKP